MRVNTNSHMQVHLMPRPYSSQLISQSFSHFRTCCRLPISPRNCSIKSSELVLQILSAKDSRVLLTRCMRKFSESFYPDPGQNFGMDPNQMVEQKRTSILNILKQSNSVLPHVIIASALLALVFPPSFTWFTTRYYAPALGFLMFAVGVNSSEKDFLEAFKRPAAILVGYIGQFVVKPILGYFFGIISVSMFGLPMPIGSGIMLVSCVSGAQLSNYATFLTDPPLAPLSIVMTSLSTATAVFVTPLLSLLLIGRRLPVDVKGMVSSISQIVVAPIAGGLLLNRFLPQLSNAIRPFLPLLSVLVTACCVGAPLAINVKSVRNPTQNHCKEQYPMRQVVWSLQLCHFTKVKIIIAAIFLVFAGMQSSLLALALANRFFQDPLVAVPPAISDYSNGFGLAVWGEVWV